MTVTIQALECGSITIDFGGLVKGQTGRIRVPVPAYLIEHPRGTVLFDLGLHPSLGQSPDRLGHLRDILTVDLPTEAELANRLGSVECDPSDVDLAVPSHLHFDHVGGLAEVPEATLVVQGAEWADACASAAGGPYVVDDFDLGHARRLLDGEHDLFGDGSLRLIPTPGHTAGHQSLLVEGRTLLVGDACYCQLALDTDALPAASHDEDRHRQTFAWLREQQRRGVELVYSHDPERWIPGTVNA
jgi:glyoxylase-like metal-dependent hydrolase (beta-lactamase superfamily II)